MAYTVQTFLFQAIFLLSGIFSTLITVNEIIIIIILNIIFVIWNFKIKYVYTECYTYLLLNIF